MNTAAFLDASPAAVVAVFVQMREEKKPQLVMADVPLGASEAVMKKFCLAWQLTKKGRGSRPCPVNGFERFLCFSDGKVAGSVFVEPLPAVVTP